MKVLAIGEARKRLPELVRKVAEGHAPIPIGRRGRCEAVLAPASGAAISVRRRPLQGLVEIVGSWSDVERAQKVLRRRIEVSLDRTARLIAGEPFRVPVRRRRRR
jgi:prevent-host-death family protein